MTLKDEIEKLVQEKIQELEERKKSSDSYWSESVAQSAKYFKSLRLLIDELVESIGPEYINARISSSFADIYVGKLENGVQQTDIKYGISPLVHEQREYADSALRGGNSFVSMYTETIGATRRASKNATSKLRKK